MVSCVCVVYSLAITLGRGLCNIAYFGGVIRQGLSRGVVSLLGELLHIGALFQHSLGTNWVIQARVGRTSLVDDWRMR